MMKLNKILVGVDFSPEADTALQQALVIARKTDAKVVMVHAGTVPEHPEGLPPAMQRTLTHFEELLREELDDKRRRLEDRRERCEDPDRVSHILVDAFPDTGLVTAAEELSADLVVVGTHGRTGFKRFMMGSVAERTIRLAETNVMVARKAAQRGFKHVLVPTDFGDTAARALDLALELVDKHGAVELFHCWELPGAGWATQDVKAAKGGSLREEVRAAVTARGRELAGTFKNRNIAITFVEREDEPAHGIQSYLDEGRHDLVVLGSHGRRGLRRFMLGSVAEATARYAPCSVVVVHARAEDAA
jgi:nucleotide-binding universal stress UspA family protein